MANSKLKCYMCGEYELREKIIRRDKKNFCSEKCFDDWIAKRAKEGLNKARKNAEKKRKAIVQQEKRDDREANRELKQRVKNNDISHQKKLTQKAFNKMRVLQELLWFKERGLEPTCISCGKPLGNDQWCCGHLKTRGASPELRYDVKNTYLQHNHRCNMMLSGDINGTKTTHGYIQGLKNRFGEEEAQKILDYVESPRPPKKYTCEELIEMRKGFNEEIRRLSKIIN